MKAYYIFQTFSPEEEKEQAGGGGEKAYCRQERSGWKQNKTHAKTSRALFFTVSSVLRDKILG